MHNGIRAHGMVIQNMAQMGVLAPGSVHARPSAQPPIDTILSELIFLSDFHFSFVSLPRISRLQRLYWKQNKNYNEEEDGIRVKITKQVKETENRTQFYLPKFSDVLTGVETIWLWHQWVGQLETIWLWQDES